MLVEHAKPTGTRYISSVNERVLVNEGMSQRGMDLDQMAIWVNMLAEWRIFSTLTFRDKLFPNRTGQWIPHGMSMWGAAKRYERFMTKFLPRVSYFYSVEPNPSRDGYHCHSLWADCRGVFRKEYWARWVKDFGWAQISAVKRQDFVSNYLSKYVVKGDAWWNFKLQWHRMQKMNDESFKLRSEDSLTMEV